MIIKFNNSDEKISLDLIAEQNYIVLTGDDLPEDCSGGFRVYDENDELIANYSEYTKVISKTSNSVKLTHTHEINTLTMEDLAAAIAELSTILIEGEE